MNDSPIFLDRSGTLVEGAFFKLYEDYYFYLPPRLREGLAAPQATAVLAPRSAADIERERRGQDYAEVAIESYRTVEHHRCPLHAEHVTEEEVVDVRYRIEFPGRAGSFMQSLGDPYLEHLIGGAFALQLRGSGLTGCGLERCQPVQDENGETVLDLHVLNFLGRHCTRPAAVRGVPNACPHCGHGPLICPGCGEQAQPCPRCSQNTISPPGSHRGSGDASLIADWGPNFLPRILDGRCWDGSDFVFYHYITRRALDWLIAAGAAPFYAEPVLICTDGMSDEQRRRLDRAMQPLPPQ